MSHLSPFFYLEQALLLIISLFFSFYRLIYIDRFQSLREFKTVPTRSISICLLVIAQLLMLSLCIMSMVFKYQEGYYVNPSTGEIRLTPKSQYSAYNFALAEATDTVAQFSFIAKSSAFFLTLGQLNRVSDKYMRSEFMSSIEFRIYAFYSFLSVPAYFIIQHSMKTPVLANVAPQILYDSESIVLSLLFAMMSFRLGHLAENTPLSGQLQKRVQAIVRNIKIVSVSCAIEFFGHGTIGIDICIHGAASFSWLVTDILSGTYAIFFSLSIVAAMMLLIPEPIDAITASSSGGAGAGSGAAVRAAAGVALSASTSRARTSASKPASLSAEIDHSDTASSSGVSDAHVAVAVDPDQALDFGEARLTTQPASSSE
jgi:hypothetical protein